MKINHNGHIPLIKFQKKLIPQSLEVENTSLISLAQRDEFITKAFSRGPSDKGVQDEESPSSSYLYQALCLVRLNEKTYELPILKLDPKETESGIELLGNNHDRNIDTLYIKIINACLDAETKQEILISCARTRPLSKSKLKRLLQVLPNQLREILKATNLDSKSFRLRFFNTSSVLNIGAKARSANSLVDLQMTKALNDIDNELSDSTRGSKGTIELFSRVLGICSLILVIIVLGAVLVLLLTDEGFTSAVKLSFKLLKAFSWGVSG